MAVGQYCRGCKQRRCSPSISVPFSLHGNLGLFIKTVNNFNEACRGLDKKIKDPLSRDSNLQRKIMHHDMTPFAADICGLNVECTLGSSIDSSSDIVETQRNVLDINCFQSWTLISAKIPRHISQ